MITFTLLKRINDEHPTIITKLPALLIFIVTMKGEGGKLLLFKRSSNI
jgi:hypothetical protein